MNEREFEYYKFITSVHGQGMVVTFQENSSSCLLMNQMTGDLVVTLMFSLIVQKKKKKHRSNNDRQRGTGQMDHEMDKDGNYPHDGYKIFGRIETEQYLQAHVGELENKVNAAREAIARRRDEIFQNAIKNKERLVRLEKAQDRIYNAGKVMTIGVVAFMSLELATGAYTLVRWIINRGKSKRKQPHSREEITYSVDDNDESEAEEAWQEEDASLVPKRLHARHWQIAE
jgi:hypothetical protein